MDHEVIQLLHGQNEINALMPLAGQFQPAGSVAAEQEIPSGVLLGKKILDAQCQPHLAQAGGMQPNALPLLGLIRG